MYINSFDVFFDLCLYKRLSKQLWGWWFEMLSCPLWRHCNEPNWHQVGYPQAPSQLDREYGIRWITLRNIYRVTCIKTLFREIGRTAAHWFLCYWRVHIFPAITALCVFIDATNGILGHSSPIILAPCGKPRGATLPDGNISRWCR